jgi:hypothetical protein
MFGIYGGCILIVIAGECMRGESSRADGFSLSVLLFERGVEVEMDFIQGISKKVHSADQGMKSSPRIYCAKVYDEYEKR